MKDKKSASLVKHAAPLRPELKHEKFKSTSGTAQTKKSITPPPVYRPQPLPRVLQPKQVPIGSKQTRQVNGISRPTDAAIEKQQKGRKPATVQRHIAPAPPPVYRPGPLPVVLQAKPNPNNQLPSIPDENLFYHKQQDQLAECDGYRAFSCRRRAFRQGARRSPYRADQHSQSSTQGGRCSTI